MNKKKIIIGVRGSKLAIKYANTTHSHPYNYMSVMLLTNLISELIYNNNFIYALLNVCLLYTSDAADD